MTVVLAVDPVLYGAYVAAWAFFAYGPQLVICMLLAWSACRRTRGDLLTWLTRGFLWSLLPFAGIVVMWWIWRRASNGPDAVGGDHRTDDTGVAGEGQAADEPHEAGGAGPASS